MESPFLVNELRVAERSDVAAAILFSAERPSPQGEVSGGHRRDSPPLSVPANSSRRPIVMFAERKRSERETMKTNSIDRAPRNVRVACWRDHAQLNSETACRLIQTRGR